MKIETALKEGIAQAFKSLFSYDLDPNELSLQPTRREFSGSYTFVVFPFLKITQSNPESSGNQIGDWLKEHLTEVKNYNVRKGFLNLEISDKSWIRSLHIMSSDDSFGSMPENGQKVMVEFSSPNTNKPLHLGHLRNNFLGDAVSRIFKANGYEVLKANLVNDRGIHICKSMLAYQKMGNGETPETSGLKGDHLVGKYYVKFNEWYKEEINTLVDEGMNPEEAKREASSIKQAQELLKKWEEHDAETVELWKKMNNWVFEGFDATYHRMGIEFDKMYKESNTYLLGKDIVDEGLEKGLFNKKDDDSVWVDLSDEGMDEKLVLRGDGTAVYITQDMGTSDMKHQDFPFDKNVFVVGNEQDYHFKVLFTIMKKLGRSYASGMYHLSYGMIDLPSGKMKSRDGTVVDADHLLQEMYDTAKKHTEELGKIGDTNTQEASTLYEILGLGALKYFLLKVDPKKRMLFNPQESIDFHGHTGPFIQYTHARIAAILRRAKTLEITTTFAESKVGDLNQREVDLIYRFTEFEKSLKEAARTYSPAVIAQYVYDLAKDYNGFYQEVPIFNEDNKDRLAFKVAISYITAHTLRKGMELLGIAVPERM
ncbi:MAG: arginine--tRNA ligase [Bacteroidota bacterium]